MCEEDVCGGVEGCVSMYVWRVCCVEVCGWSYVCGGLCGWVCECVCGGYEWRCMWRSVVVLGGSVCVDGGGIVYVEGVWRCVYGSVCGGVGGWMCGGVVVRVNECV